MKIDNVTIIGVGLIGGSFAKGIKDSGKVKKITGYGSREGNLKKAVELGVIDDYTLDAKTAVEDADLVLLSVPLGSMESVLSSIKPFLPEHTLLTDVGSSKMSVIKAVNKVFGELPSTFVAGHPIAGKEQSGVTAASADLFVDHRVLLTPTEQTDTQATATVKQLWETLGACVTEMAPDYHDEVLAATSHLPHMLAYALVGLLNEHEELGNVFQYTAGGFRDFTRIASSDATMWRDICLNNDQAIVKWLKNYQAEIDYLIKLVENKQADDLYQLFDQAKTARDTHIVKETLNN